MSPLAVQTYRINQDAARIRNIRLEMESENQEPKCADCGGQPDWDGEICWNCRDERKRDAELFARGIV